MVVEREREKKLQLWIAGEKNNGDCLDKKRRGHHFKEAMFTGLS